MESVEKVSPAELLSPESPEVEFVPDHGYGFRFWMVIISLMATVLLSALDLTATGPALPKISNDLHMASFTWIASSYVLASTALLPFYASLSGIFGRKPLLIIAIVLFALGSALAASAHGEAQIIIGRTIQGTGGGGILALVDIVVSDMVPLAKRGLYMGLFGAVWALASAAGPSIGGLLADSNWRWLFWLNLPVCGLSLALVVFFLNFHVPEASFRQRLARIDISGNVIFIVSTTLLCVGLTLGGGDKPWTSAIVLSTIIIGALGLVLFFVVEWFWIAEPTIPKEVISNSTSLIGYITTFLHGAIIQAIVYYFPLWIQAVKGRSPVLSGVSMFSLSFSIAPFAIVAGAVITITARYYALNVVGWAIIVLGMGLFIMFDTDSSFGLYNGLPVILGVGSGLIYTAPSFQVLAPIPVSQTAHALGFQVFMRSFGQVVGTVLGSTILINKMGNDLPAEVKALLGPNSNVVYTPLNILHELSPTLLRQTREVYTNSMRSVWIASTALAGLGLIVALFAKDIKLQTVTDERYRMKVEHTEESISSKV